MNFLLYLVLQTALSIDSYFDPKFVTQINSTQIRFYIEKPDYQTILIIYDLMNYKSIFLGEALLPILPRLTHLVKIFALSCEFDPDFCTPDTKEDLPTIQMFIPRGISPLTQKPVVSEKLFSENIHPENLSRFITENVPYLGDFVDVDYLEEFLALPSPKVLIFLKDDDIENDLKVLSSKFRGRLEFGVVYINQTEILERFKVYRFPSVLVVNKDKTTWFDGVFIYEDLVKFLTPFAVGEKQPLRPRKFLKEFFDPNELAHMPEFPVIQVSSANFSSVFRKIEDFSLIHVFKDTPSSLWEKLYKEFKGVLKFYEFRLADENMPPELGPQKVPFIKLLPFKKTKGMTVTSGNLKDLETEVSLALKSEVSVLHDDSLSSFISTLETQSKVGFLLVSQDKVPVQIKALGKVPSFQNFLKIGFTNSPKDQILKRFNINRYPSFFGFVKQKAGVRVLEFRGKLNDYPSLHYFIEEIALPKLLIPLSQSFHQLEDLEDLDPVKEIKTFSMFSKSCLTSSHVCLLLPQGFQVTFKQSSRKAKDQSSEDSKMTQNMKMVQAVVSKRSFYMKVFSFNHVCHDELIKSLGVDSQGKSVVLALDSDREELAVFDSKPDPLALLDFVFKVLKREVEFSHFNTSAVAFKDKQCAPGGKQEL